MVTMLEYLKNEACDIDLKLIIFEILRTKSIF